MAISAAIDCSRLMRSPISRSGRSLPDCDHVQHRAVAMRLHAVAAEQFELVGDDPAHRNARRAVIAQQQSDLNVLAALPQAADRIEAGRRRPKRVDRHMRAASRRLDHRFGDVGDGIGVDRRDGAQVARQGELVVGNVDADHVGADGVGDHHRGKPDAAAAVHRDPLPGARLALVDDGAKGGREAATEARRRVERHGFGQRDEVQIGPVDRDEFGERAPVGEAGLELVVANLLLSRLTLRAFAAAADEGNRHAIARLPFPDVLADGFDDAGKLMARHMGQRDVLVVPDPAVPVAAANARRLDAHARPHALRASGPARSPASAVARTLHRERLSSRFPSAREQSRHLNPAGMARRPPATLRIVMCYENACRSFSVMAGLVPAIHVYAEADRRPRWLRSSPVRRRSTRKSWMAGSSPAMTTERTALRFRPTESPQGGRNLDEGIGLAALKARAAHPFLGSTWPPKPLRIAEMIFSAKVCSWRERKRA